MNQVLQTGCLFVYSDFCVALRKSFKNTFSPCILPSPWLLSSNPVFTSNLGVAHLVIDTWLATWVYRKPWMGAMNPDPHGHSPHPK